MKLVRPVKKSYVVTFSYSEHVAYAIEHNLGNSYRPGIDYVGYHTDSTDNVPIYSHEYSHKNHILQFFHNQQTILPHFF